MNLQVLCGLLLLIDYRSSRYSLCLFFLIYFCIAEFHYLLWIDYVPELLGFAVALFLSSNPMRAVKYLRVLMGIQLMILAIHNKLINPYLGLEFLEIHQWNIFPYLGLNSFTDQNFIIGIGLAELTFGLLLLFGIATRLVALMVMSVFCLTGILLGITELVGHLPIVGAFLVIFSLGRGESDFNELKVSNVLRKLGELSYRVYQYLPVMK